MNESNETKNKQLIKYTYFGEPLLNGDLHSTPAKLSLRLTGKPREMNTSCQGNANYSAY